jgi:hypothetical protein
VQAATSDCQDSKKRRVLTREQRRNGSGARVQWTPGNVLVFDCFEACHMNGIPLRPFLQ